jgi:hypothetical protein
MQAPHFPVGGTAHDSHFEGGGMNGLEELLAKALVCLNEASKIEDAAMRAKVLDLVYQSQQVAQAALLRELDEARSKLALPAENASLAAPASSTNPKAPV